MSFDSYDINKLYLSCKILNIKVNKDTKKKELVKLLDNKLESGAYIRNIDYSSELHPKYKSVVKRASGVGGIPVPVNEYIITKNLSLSKKDTKMIEDFMSDFFHEFKTAKMVEKNLETFKRTMWDYKEEKIKLVREDIKQLKKIIKGAPKILEDLLLFRGIKGMDNFITENKKQEKIINKYTSLKTDDVFSFDIFSYFSLRPMHSMNYMGLNCCFFKLNIKADSYPVFFTGNSRQKEIIFNPDVKFKVNKVRNIASEFNSNLKLRVYDISIY